MPHYPHYSPPPPPHRSPLPPPPPPPPVPQEVLDDAASPGPPRCYFCGKLIAREEDVQKTRYDVGHGQRIFVMICPVCTRQKARGEGPFAKDINVGAVVGVIAFIAFVLFMFFAVIRPFTDDRDRAPKPIQQDWNRDRLKP